jgi:small-conductance mechanosensitive channel
VEDPVRKWLFDPTVAKLLAATIFVLAVVVLVRFFQRTLSRHISDVDTRYRARKIASFAGYLLAVLGLGFIFSDKLRGLGVALGVAGAGIAFALQEVIVSVAGWFAINFSNFYKTGDRVQLGGIKGDVIDIGIVRTTLMEVGEWVKGDLYTGRVVRLANSFVFKEPVFNYSGDFPFLWDEIVLPIKYGSDYRHAQELMLQVANGVVGEYGHSVRDAWKELVSRFRVEDARIEPAVTVAANENWMLFTVRYVVDYKRRRSARDELYIRLVEAIEATRGRVQVACSTLEVTLAPQPSPEPARGGVRAE